MARSSSSHGFRKVMLPNLNDMSEDDKQTLKTMEAFKKSITTKYSAAPASTFIRRKLALLLFKQKHPHTNELTDDFIHDAIDRKIRSLKEYDTRGNNSHTDEVLIEILIRTNFDEEKAREMFQHNCPNLTVPVRSVVPKASTATSLGDSLNALKQCRRQLRESTNGNDASRKTLRPNDKWQKVNHIIPTIQQLRRQVNAGQPNEVSFSRMYRLLSSELSHTIAQQSSVKIEVLISLLFEVPVDVVDLLDLATLKNILTSSGDSYVSENFRDYAMNLLSIECSLCVNSFPRSQMESMYLCKHTCCSDCIKRYYENTISNIRDSSSINRLTCFQQAHEIPEELQMDFFIYLDIKIKQWFTDKPNIIQLYQENIFNARRDKQIIKKCGNSKCISYFSVDNNQRIASTRCPHCRFAQCQVCCRKWCKEHANISCDEYETWLSENDPDDPHVQVLNYLSSSAIVCPNPSCKNIYEYAPGGCGHFTCRLCQTAFCRVCSTLFYGSKETKKCPQPNCALNGLHAHCPPNCFRETRDSSMDVLAKLLTDHGVDFKVELQKTPVSTDKKCPIEGCDNETCAAGEHRLCEPCYRNLLCLLIWNHQIPPWDVYENNNLQQMLKKVPVPIPANATRQNLIDLCHKNLNQSLGKPKRLTKANLAPR